MHEHASYTNTPHRIHPWGCKLTRTREFVRVCQCGLGCMPTTRTGCVSDGQNTHTLTHRTCVSAAQNMPTQNMPTQAHTHSSGTHVNLSPHLPIPRMASLSLSLSLSLCPPPSPPPLSLSLYILSYALIARNQLSILCLGYRPPGCRSAI
jgi:hypothetical protein